MSAALTSRWLCRLVLLTTLGSVLIGVGCSSKPKVDWNARVGNFTYDQAILELGPPDMATELTDGARLADWYQGRAPSVSFGFGVGSYGGGGGVGAGAGTTTGGRGRFLRLTFDDAGLLMNVERVTR